LQDGHLWSLHETEGGEAGDDVRLLIYFIPRILTSWDIQLLRYMIYDPLTEEESSKTNGVMLNGHTDFNSIRFPIFARDLFVI
jgi:hypothetical protein